MSLFGDGPCSGLPNNPCLAGYARIIRICPFFQSCDRRCIGDRNVLQFVNAVASSMAMAAPCPEGLDAGGIGSVLAGWIVAGHAVQSHSAGLEV